MFLVEVKVRKVLMNLLTNYQTVSDDSTVKLIHDFWFGFQTDCSLLGAVRRN